MGALHILVHADSVEVAHRQIGLGRGVILLRRLEVALRRPGLVLLHAGAVLIAQAQVALGGGVVLLRRLLKELRRTGLVLLHPCAGLVTAPQQVGGPEIPVLRGQGKPAGRLGWVLVGPVALGIAHAKVVIDGGVSALRLLQQGLELLAGALESLHRLLNQMGIHKNDLLDPRRIHGYCWHSCP